MTIFSPMMTTKTRMLLLSFLGMRGMATPLPRSDELTSRIARITPETLQEEEGEEDKRSMERLIHEASGMRGEIMEKAECVITVGATVINISTWRRVGRCPIKITIGTTYK